MMESKRYKLQLDAFQLTSMRKGDRIPLNRGTFQIRYDLSATVTKRRPVNNIQGVSGGIVNILRGGSMEYSE
jgi:hypothetical protein